MNACVHALVNAKSSGRNTNGYLIHISFKYTVFFLLFIDDSSEKKLLAYQTFELRFVVKTNLKLDILKYI